MSGARETLVFLPGSLCDRRLFAPQIEYFSGHCGSDYELLVCDLSTYNSIAAMAESVLAVAPEQSILVGLSMGGLVALEVTRIAPTRVRALALLGSNPAKSEHSHIQTREAQIDRVKEQGLKAVREIIDALASTYFADQKPNMIELQALVRDMAMQAGADTFINHWQAINSRDELTMGLVNITQPVLVLGGDQDRLCPPEWQRNISAMLLNAELNIIPNCGHLSTLEAPAAVNASLDALIQRTGVQ